MRGCGYDLGRGSDCGQLQESRSLDYDLYSLEDKGTSDPLKERQWWTHG